jgi:hypothetical protein
MKIKPLPTAMISAAVALWKLAGLTRPWNDPLDDLQRTMEGPASTVFPGIDDGVLVVMRSSAMTATAEGCSTSP